MNGVIVGRSDLFALPEYSCSVPTGVTIGKKWRRNVNFGKPDTEPEWIIGEYVRTYGRVTILWQWALDHERETHRGHKAYTEISHEA